MGLDVNGTKFLMHAKANGVRFGRMAMIGRQGLHLDAGALKQNLADFGYTVDDSAAQGLLTADGGYAEGFLKLLGATEIRSFDAAPYEQATDVHDFNLPIEQSLKNHFELVLDGGSLEHVFNFPTAIRNCMEMVEVGGHFISITPANNFFGHGFYQFSPELFFRIFTARNGFALERIMAFEDSPGTKWYEVTDPEAIRERVYLINASPTYLAVVARKTAAVPIFAQPPQQSDYVVKWQPEETGPATSTAPTSATLSPMRKLKRLALTPLKMLYRPVRQFLRDDADYYNPKFFKNTRIP